MSHGNKPTAARLKQVPIRSGQRIDPTSLPPKMIMTPEQQRSRYRERLTRLYQEAGKQCEAARASGNPKDIAASDMRLARIGERYDLNETEEYTTKLNIGGSILFLLQTVKELTDTVEELENQLAEVQNGRTDTVQREQHQTSGDSSSTQLPGEEEG